MRGRAFQRSGIKHRRPAHTAAERGKELPGLPINQRRDRIGPKAAHRPRHRINQTRVQCGLFSARTVRPLFDKQHRQAIFGQLAANRAAANAGAYDNDIPHFISHGAPRKNGTNRPCSARAPTLFR